MVGLNRKRSATVCAGSFRAGRRLATVVYCYGLGSIIVGGRLSFLKHHGWQFVLAHGEAFLLLLDCVLEGFVGAGWRRSYSVGIASVCRSI